VKPRRTLDMTASPYRLFAAVGGIGAGMFFALEGDHTLGRNESRPGRLLDVRDYCKLHIISHYFSVLTGGDPSGKNVRVLPIGKVGDDEAGARLVREMTEAGMDMRFVETVHGKPTLLSVCFQYPDGSGGNITTSDAAASALVAGDIDRAESIMAGAEGHFIALAAPEVPLEARLHLLQLATKHKGLRVAAFTSAEIPEALEMDMLPLVVIIALNEDEAAAITGVAFDENAIDHFLCELSTDLGKANSDMRIILSAGREGAHGFEDGVWQHTPAARVEVASTAGAGDALLSGTLAGIAAGTPFIVEGPARESLTDAPLRSALDFGVLLAALSVTSPHTIHPTADLGTLVVFAEQLGVTFSNDLAKRFI
jgi:sugar/nucleoside kinase (ribokinase family)